MMQRTIAIGLLSVTWVLGALGALGAFAGAADDDSELTDIVKSRQANLRDLGGAFKGITDELKKSQPQLLAIKQYANQIDDLAQQQKFWFPRGSGRELGIKTAAKDEIWTRAEEFQKAQATLRNEAAALVKAMSSGDLGALREQHKSLGKACAGCHRVFREKEDD